MGKNTVTRRQFLKGSSRAGLSAAAIMGTAQLGAMASVSAQTHKDYKALVCILLGGGADSFNILTPRDNTHYQEYKNTRTDLALPQSSLLSLPNAQNNGRELGIHPRLTGIKSLYEKGHIAFLSNVGTLVEPTTPQQLKAGTAKLPLGLQSHADQINQVQTAVPDSRNRIGWGGRLADILAPQNLNQNISMSISVSGTNEFQAGLATDSFTIVPGDQPTPMLTGLGALDSPVRAGLEKVFSNNNHSNILRNSYQKMFNNSIKANQEFARIIASGQTITTQFQENAFSKQLQTVAKTIATNQLLGMRRQTFFVTYGDWDHHDEVLNSMNGKLKVFNDAIVSFQSAMQELGLEKNVTAFTTSDFARTLSSNGRGSDHGWGGNHMIIGGAVKGGNIYGSYPSLKLNNPLDTGRGVLMPTTSLDLYFAELALWFGVSPGSLDYILPNINRFYDKTKGTPPLGFMT